MENDKVVLFYAHVENVSIFEDVSFYEQDIRALKEMGLNVIVSNNICDFFLLKYDLVFIWWWSRAIIPIVLAPFKGAKVCVAGAFHYSTPLMSGTDYVRRSWIFKAIVKFCLKRADSNIFVSNYELERVVKNLTVNNPCLVHHGINVEKYKPVKKWRLAGPKTIFTITWLEENNLERKCVFQSLLAFDHLVKEGVNANYYIAGREGPGSERLKEFIKGLACKDRIFLLGHISEERKVELLQTVDVFLSPSLYEGFGVAIAEALACGVPVVTSANGAVEEVAGSCALYADPHDPLDIAKNITMVLEDEMLSAKLKFESVRRVRRSFSYSAHYSVLKKVIENILEKENG